MSEAFKCFSMILVFVDVLGIFILDVNLNFSYFCIYVSSVSLFYFFIFLFNCTFGSFLIERQ